MTASTSSIVGLWWCCSFIFGFESGLDVEGGEFEEVDVDGAEAKDCSLFV